MSTKIETTASGQKFIRLEIPNYNHDADSNRHPLTYLHLGAAVDGGSAGDKREGDDLLDLVKVGEFPYFKDDWRFKHSRTHPDTVYTRDDGYKSETTDPETLTKELRTRGGFRLHTDGNYVSTTRGDRIDVIYGNYKQVVLGRMAIGGDWGETYWESSGGHTRWATNTQGDMVMVKWNADRDRWRTVEETLKGDSISRYQGIVEEIYECPQMISRVGSADADGATVIEKSAASDTTGPHTQTDEDSCWLNPASRKKERPNVKETVVAKTITAKTKVAASLGAETDGPAAGTIVTDTTITSKKSESTMALCIMDETTCDGGVTIDSQTGFRAELGANDAITSENLRINDYQSILLSLCNFSLDTYTTRKKKGYSNWTLNVNLVATSISLSLFGESVTMPDFMAPSPNRLEVGLTLASTTDIWIGTKTDINLNFRAGLRIVETLDISIPAKVETTVILTDAELQKLDMKAGHIGVKAVDFTARANTTET